MAKEQTKNNSYAVYFISFENNFTHVKVEGLELRGSIEDADFRDQVIKNYSNSTITLIEKQVGATNHRKIIYKA